MSPTALYPTGTRVTLRYHRPDDDPWIIWYHRRQTPGFVVPSPGLVDQTVQISFGGRIWRLPVDQLSLVGA